MNRLIERDERIDREIDMNRLIERVIDINRLIERDRYEQIDREREIWTDW